MSIIELSESKISLPSIDSNVVLSSDFMNSISEKNLESVVEAIRYLTLSKEKTMNPQKFDPYIVGCEVDHIDLNENNYPNDRELKVYMSSGFLFYKGIFYIPEVIIPIKLKYRVTNPDASNRDSVPYVYISEEEINLYFNISKVLDSYKEPRDIFDGKKFIKKLVNSSITYEVKIHDSNIPTDTSKEFLKGIQFGRITRTKISDISTDFQSYNRKVISTDGIKKDSSNLLDFMNSETSKTKLDYYKKFQVGEIYKLNHLKREIETPEFPFITGDTPLSLVDKEKTPDFYDYLHNYKLPFGLLLDGFIRNDFPRNSSGKCILTLFFNLKTNSVVLNDGNTTEYLQGNIIPYLLSMLPMHPMRTVNLDNFKNKKFNDHLFGTSNEAVFKLDKVATLRTKEKDGNVGSIDSNLHSDSMPEKSKGIVGIHRKFKTDIISGNSIVIENDNVIRRGSSDNSSIFDVAGNSDTGIDFSRDYFLSAFNGSVKSVKLYRDSSIESDTSKATHIGITIDDFCFMSKNATYFSFMHSPNSTEPNWVLEFYPYRIPQMPSFEFIPANVPWGKGLTKPVNSKSASQNNTDQDGGWCSLDSYNLTTEQHGGTLNSSVWYCDGYANGKKLLTDINELALKYMVPETPANESQEVTSSTGTSKKIIYTGHSAIDGNNKPTIMIPNSTGQLFETKIENTILDMELRHSKKSNGVWNFIYPRLILPLFIRQKKTDGSDLNFRELSPDSARFPREARQDEWTIWSYLRPVTFIWQNNSMNFETTFTSIINSMVPNFMKMTNIRNFAQGAYRWVVVAQKKIVGEAGNIYDWRYIPNWFPRDAYSSYAYSFSPFFFVWSTALIYNYIRIQLDAYNYGVFNGSHYNNSYISHHIGFQIPTVNYYQGDFDSINTYFLGYDRNVNNNFYRGSNVQLPYAWLEEYKRGYSDLYVYLTGLFFDRNTIKNIYSKEENKALNQKIDTLISLNQNSIDTTNSFSIYTPYFFDDATEHSVSRPLFPFYVFGGSIDKNAGAVMYTTSLATDTMPESNTNEYTFIFPLENSEVTDKVSGRYPIPVDRNEYGGEIAYLIDEYNPHTLKKQSESITTIHRGKCYNDFDSVFKNPTFSGNITMGQNSKPTPINESIGFRWSFANGETQNYFRYYSLMVIEEFKRKKDFDSLYFIGVDLDNINKPGNRYAVWYPNRNFFGAKEIDDYIIDIIRKLSNLKSPIEVFDSAIFQSSSKLENGFDSYGAKEENVSNLISSGGLSINDKKELTNSFLQSLNIWGVDTSIVIYDPTNFYTKKFGGNDWILTLPTDVQLSNSPGTNVSGNLINETYSSKLKENFVKKDKDTIRFSMSPYSKKDGFSYIYIGKVI